MTSSKMATKMRLSKPITINPTIHLLKKDKQRMLAITNDVDGFIRQAILEKIDRDRVTEHEY